MKRLKPCPFCGGKAHIVKHDFSLGVSSTYGVLCNNGKCYTAGWQFYDTEEEAADAWNRRAELTDLELDEKLQKKYDEGFMDGQDYAVSVM